MNTPEDVLRKGCRILEKVLEPAGFQYVEGLAGASSGGLFASGAYVKDRRAIELHFRHSLGLVTYRFDRSTVGHEALLRSTGAWGRHAYPGFSDDPLDGFRHLQFDLEHHLSVFPTGSDRQAEALVAAAILADEARPKGLAALP